VARTPAQTLAEAQRLLDAGRPFHAHEVFEDAWKAAHDAPEAGLWKALAQLAVGRTHQLRGNAVGAQRLLLRAAVGLTPYAPAAPHHLNLTQLIDWAEQPAGRTMPRLRSVDPPDGASVRAD
jgi:predicted metal-dependent hydrolase